MGCQTYYIVSFVIQSKPLIRTSESNCCVFYNQEMLQLAPATIRVMCQLGSYSASLCVQFVFVSENGKATVRWTILFNTKLFCSLLTVCCSGMNARELKCWKFHLQLCIHHESTTMKIESECQLLQLLTVGGERFAFITYCWQGCKSKDGGEL